MAHVYVDIEVVGSQGRRVLKRVPVDTGATFTVLPPDVLEEVGAWRIPVEAAEVELGDGRRVKVELYAIGIRLGSRWSGTIVAGIPNAKPVVGVRTLEDLGLKPNPITGELEEERPPGVIYL